MPGTTPTVTRALATAAATGAALAIAAVASPQASPEPRAAAAVATAAAAEVERDIAYLGAGGPRLDVHRPPAHDRPAAAVLVVHGGAWSGGDKAAIGHVARTLAAAGFVAVNVNYTLAAPGRPGQPRQLDELRAAVRWVRANARRLGVDPARIGALGSSAGGHLAALLATQPTGPLTGGDRIAALVAWSAPLDLAAPRLRSRLRYKIAGLLGCVVCVRRAVDASPLAHAGPGDTPALIVNSRRELIPAGQARRFAARLREAGVARQLLLVPGRQHAPRYSPATLAPSIAFLRRRLR